MCVPCARGVCGGGCGWLAGDVAQTNGITALVWITSPRIVLRIVQNEPEAAVCCASACVCVRASLRVCGARRTRAMITPDSPSKWACLVRARGAEDTVAPNTCLTRPAVTGCVCVCLPSFRVAPRPLSDEANSIMGNLRMMPDYPRVL